MAGRPRRAWRAPIRTNIACCEVLSPHWTFPMKHPRMGRIVSAGPNKVFLDSLSDVSGWSILWILSGITVTSAPVSILKPTEDFQKDSLLLSPNFTEKRIIFFFNLRFWRTCKRLPSGLSLSICGKSRLLLGSFFVCDPEIFRSDNSGSKAGVWMDL